MKNYLSRRNDFDLGFNNFFDGLDDFFSPVFFERKNEMRTDVKNTDNGYELSVDMPGYDKNDIKNIVIINCNIVIYRYSFTL